MTFIRWGREFATGKTPSVAELGGKGYALALLSSQLPVPDWFAVTPAAFDGILGGLDVESPGSPRALPPIVRADLSAAAAQLCPAGDAVAVRSSAADEDSAALSFAGQLESYLFVHPSDIEARVLDVCRSAQSERVRAYRQENGLSDRPVAPAVIVQKMIDADVSGVAFSADPVTGRRDITVVSALWGLGTALVSGESDSDTYHIDASGTIVERAIAHKQFAHRRTDATIEGVAALPVPALDADRPALSDADVKRVAELVRKAEAFFKVPQDIEWALQGSTLYLLQSRPITTLANTATKPPEAGTRDEAINLWDNSNIAESYGGVTTPLTFSFARHAYEGAYRQFCRLLRIPERTIAAHDNTFRNMLGFIRGRVYYNLLNWYRVLGLLPGYKMNRRFMEQMMGVKERPRDGLLQRESPPSTFAKFKDSINLAAVLFALVAHFVTLQRRIDHFYARLQATLGEKRPDYSNASPAELAAAYRAMEGKLLTHWDAPLINDLFAMIFFGTLSRLCSRWCGDGEGTLQNGLISGEGGMVSAEPAQCIREMARLATADASTTAALSNGTLTEALAALTRVPELRLRYDDYLDKFGDRTTDELKLETPTLFEDPLMLLRAVGRLAAGAPTASPPTEPHSDRDRSERIVRQALARRPLSRIVFRWVLKHARARVVARENLRFERTRLFGRIRALFSELGRRFEQAGILRQASDIFYLEIEEILGFIEGTATTAELGKLATLRRSEFDVYRSEPPPPDRFETVGMVGLHSTPEQTLAADVGGETRRGLGCCPGVVRGRARVVSDPRHAILDKGDILVAERTDPGWVMLFPSAAGLLVERGSLLSHSAIVAREMRLPAVVAISGVTRWLKDGDWVEFDGGTGIVRRLPEPGADEAARLAPSAEAHA
ncbi:MAG: PEP-utilizing enzyme [Candidatus Eremiobacteraeota bacterium]|nr:PEP-utilizing enzyme [Candidatus Eremiobacteraeota bacterium]